MPRLSNSVDIIFLFGTVTILLSKVRIRVERNPTFSTVPVILPVDTRSPTKKGLSKNIVNEPNKFSKLSLDAIAIAIPPMPTPAAKAVTSISNILLNKTKNKTIYTAILPSSIIKGIN